MTFSATLSKDLSTCKETSSTLFIVLSSACDLRELPMELTLVAYPQAHPAQLACSYRVLAAAATAMEVAPSSK